MSEHMAIDADRQLKLRSVVERLHDGASVAEVKRDFAAIIKGASAAEIAAMEQALVDSGFPVEEIQRLCEVHVEVFETALEKGAKPSKMPGHPLHSFMAENRVAEKKIKALLKAAKAAGRRPLFGTASAPPEGVAAARLALNELAAITIHFERKENQLFPYLERHGFTGPSRVMWGKHDEIRAELKAAAAAIEGGEAKTLRAAASRLAKDIGRMIFMEEHILYPESQRRLSEAEWAAIRAGEAAIGWAWIQPGAEYDHAVATARSAAGGKAQSALEELIATAKPIEEAPVEGDAAPPAGVALNTGLVPAEVLDLALRNLPLDLSIVDENDRVLYYSDSPERIFPRSPAVIGRAVQNCHPQKSVATVQRILDAFRDGSKDSARFWIQMGPRFVVIEYRALRDAEGRYRGALEVSQDAAGLRALEGQRRLLDWED